MQRSVRAKFRVEWIETPDDNAEMRTIHLYPVASSDPDSENAKYWKATPSGCIELSTVNPAAWERFELGREYYVDFTPAGGD